jgi:hypothetical protein
MSNVRQYLPLVARPNKEQAPALNAFLDGADEIVAQLEQYSEYAQNQFFFTTADAEYVFKLAARNGFYLPRDAGLNVEGLKPLAPLMINQPKTTLALLIQIMEIYFSQPLSRPNIVCAQPEPYRLKEGDDLIVKTREAEHRLTIDSTMFSSLKNITASELATYINSIQDHYIAAVFYDRAIGKNKIRLIASGSGPNEIIQVAGGTLQNLLLFPNVIPTTNTVQTRWLISKIADYSDIITFTYQSGPLPSVFLTKVGDIVTIRNQFDVGASGTVNIPIQDIFGDDIIDNNGNLVTVAVNLVQGNYSVLNGTYEIIEMGYDYFKIRNKYLRLPINNQGELLQLSPRDVIFTENVPHRVYEQSAFSYLSEMTDDELAITVPAVPPIVKRFLEGAWHIYGIKHPVQDFTRSSLKISVATSVQLPPQGTTFVLESPMFTADYSKKKFKVLSINTTNGIMTLDTSDEYAVLPYTSPTLVGVTNPFFCDFDSDMVELEFDYRHGLIQNSQIIINAATTNPANSLNLNGTWTVNKVISPTKISFKINQKNIAPPSTSTAILYALGNKRYRLQYSSTSALNLSKLGFIGKKFKLYEDGTASVFNSYAWQQLKTRVHVVSSVGTNSVDFDIVDDWSVIPNQVIASNVKIQTTEVHWGGSNTTCYFDKTASNNQAMFLNNLEMIIADYVKPESPLFLGSYLYDPQGVVYKYLPSNVGTNTNARILKGESGVIALVDSAAEFSFEGGYVVFNYGTATEEGPVRYLALSGNQIVIDPAYTFKFSHENGATVRQVKQLTPFSPSVSGTMFQPFLTGTSKARDSFFEIIKTVISAGVFVTEDVLYPELRFADESIKPYE